MIIWHPHSCTAPCPAGYFTRDELPSSWSDPQPVARRRSPTGVLYSYECKDANIFSHICVSLARYLQWLGVKTRIFHLGDYRRATIGPEGAVPEDYFFPDASPSSVILRQKILKKCREDIYAWLNHENGQVAIYDAVNPTASGRRSLAKELGKHDVQVITPQNEAKQPKRSKLTHIDFVY